MSKQIRQALIIEKIKREKSVSKSQIVKYLQDNDLVFDDRTLQRDFKEIRDNYLIDIVCDRKTNEYYIDKTTSSPNCDVFINHLELVLKTNFIFESLNQVNQSFQNILFETKNEFEGIEHLKPLLKAINDQFVISFNHYNFDKEITKSHEVKPLLLKEYQSRWYLLAQFTDSQYIRTFGIDRISDLDISTNKFKLDPKLDYKHYYDEVIGIFVNNEIKSEKVILSFPAWQGKYIKSLPWHESQKTILDNESELVIELFIKPNNELLNKIMMLGSNIKVLQPQSLIDQVKNEIELMIEKYNH